MINRIVVTGLGCITPIGNDVNTFWSNCLEGTKGFAEINAFDASLVKTHLAGEVTDFDAKSLLGRKQSRRLDRYAQFAVAAARQAIEKSNITVTDSNRIGVCMGTGVGGIQSYEEETLKMHSQGSTYVNPLLMPKWIPNMAAANVAMDLQLHGPVHTISTACASGIDAIGHAVLLIDSGRSDIVLAGGAEACITPTMISGFENMGALSLEENPEKASIPFDKNRNGFVLGEGAAVLVIESLESALKRNARILAEIKGYGSTTDAHHLTAPHPEAAGGIRAIEEALDEAKLSANQIDYVNMHGTSTPQNDKVESMCMNSVFGDAMLNISVNSTKSLVGHMQGAAGALESLVSVLSIMHDEIHPTSGTQTIDPEINLNVVLDETVKKPVHYALNNALGFGGHNAAIIFGKYLD